MSSQAIILIVAIVAVIAFLAVRRSGPRVTQIDRTIHKREDSDDA